MTGLDQRDDDPLFVEIRERAWSPNQQVLNTPMLIEDCGEAPAAEPMDIDARDLVMVEPVMVESEVFGDDAPVVIDVAALTRLPASALTDP